MQASEEQAIKLASRPVQRPHALGRRSGKKDDQVGATPPPPSLRRAKPLSHLAYIAAFVLSQAQDKLGIESAGSKLCQQFCAQFLRLQLKL